MKRLRPRHREAAVYAYAALALILIFAAMCIITRTNPCSYKYKSYLLQAQAWLRGETALDRNYEYLELAIFNEKYYVSFPPVPSVPMVLYSLIFGDAVPGGLFQKIYILLAGMLILSELLRAGKMRPAECAAWAVLFCAGSALLPISLIGAVWYEAQILAFLFSIAAIVSLRRGRTTSGCILYALSVGCRPFAVLLGPVLLAMFLERHRRLPPSEKIRRLIPGICAGLLIAACYGAYNYIRFGDPLEFGHNYLPEFMRSEDGQMSVHYLWGNLKILLLGSPVTVNSGSVSLSRFGFSMFLSCPVFICGAVWLIRDILHRHMNAVKWLSLLMCIVNCILLCLHRTLGGFQFGMRYALEMAPFCFICLLKRKKLHGWEAALMLFGFIFNFAGGCLLHV